MNLPRLSLLSVAVTVLALQGCSGDDKISVGMRPSLPSLAAATGARLSSCTDLATRIDAAPTTIKAANTMAAGTLMVAGTPVAAHCQEGQAPDSVTADVRGTGNPGGVNGRPAGGPVADAQPFAVPVSPSGTLQREWQYRAGGPLRVPIEESRP